MTKNIEVHYINAACLFAPLCCAQVGKTLKKLTVDINILNGIKRNFKKNLKKT